MDIRILATIPIAMLGFSACSQEDAPRTGPATATQEPVAAAAPAAPASSDDVIHIAGTVEKLDVEGGVYVIRAEDGTQYRPIELPEEFRVEGVAVDVDAKRRDDVLTKDMVGQSIELLDIRRRAAE